MREIDRLLILYKYTHTHTYTYTLTHAETEREREVDMCVREESSLMAYWNTLQHVATHCNTLQRTATHFGGRSVCVDGIALR